MRKENRLFSFDCKYPGWSFCCVHFVDAAKNTHLNPNFVFLEENIQKETFASSLLLLTLLSEDVW